jgi:hypothetical protein
MACVNYGKISYLGQKEQIAPTKEAVMRSEWG